MPAIESQVLAKMHERDRRDKERAIALLMPAADAFILDTSEMNAEMALSMALAYVTQKIASLSSLIRGGRRFRICALSGSGILHSSHTLLTSRCPTTAWRDAEMRKASMPMEQ